MLAILLIGVGREIIFWGLNSWIASSKGKMEQNTIGEAMLCIFKKAVWKVYYWHSPPLNFPPQ